MTNGCTGDCAMQSDWFYPASAGQENRVQVLTLSQSWWPTGASPSESCNSVRALQSSRWSPGSWILVMTRMRWRMITRTRAFIVWAAMTSEWNLIVSRGSKVMSGVWSVKLTEPVLNFSLTQTSSWRQSWGTPCWRGTKTWRRPSSTSRGW